jgi:hypothetical protein
VKSSPLLIPPRDQDSAAALATQSQRALKAAADELYFQVVLAPGSGGEGPAIDVTTEFHSFILPAAALTPVHSTRPMRALWPKTRVRVTTWTWTGGGVPGTFSMRLNVAQTGDGFGVGAPAYPVFNSDFTISPVMNVVKKTVWNAAGIINSSPGELLKVYIARKNDGNANVLNLMCALVEFQEVA